MAGIPDHSFKARRGACMHSNKTGRPALAHARAQASGFAKPCPHLGRYMQFWRQHRQVIRVRAESYGACRVGLDARAVGLRQAETRWNAIDTERRVALCSCAGSWAAPCSGCSCASMRRTTPMRCGHGPVQADACKSGTACACTSMARRPVLAHMMAAHPIKSIFCQREVGLSASAAPCGSARSSQPPSCVNQVVP